MRHATKKLCSLIALILATSMLLCSCGDADWDWDEDFEKSDIPEDSEDVSYIPEGSEDVSYVLVYNPSIYKETNKNNDSLFSGDFGNQILIDTDRADESTQDPIINTFPQDMLNGKLPTVNPEPDRASDMFTPYKEGDTASFYVSIPNPDGNRVLTEFECVATTEYANAWVVKGENSLDTSGAKSVLQTFDDTVYPKDTDLFGEARFADNGHKVNILFHRMTQGYLGYFILSDLFSKQDGVTDSEIKEYGVNLDHAIIHVNADLAGEDEYTETLNATIAHEFQHLICFSSTAENGFKAMPSTWLNEAMSGYVEEYLYPGIQKANERYKVLEQSSLIRHGQSLYNFKTELLFSHDIGVYGSVYLFSEYLAKKGGSEVFQKIHNSYRDGDASMNEGKAIADALSSSVKDRIDSVISYPSGFVNLDEDETFLSKLTLDFYLSLLQCKDTDPDAFQELKTEALLYDEMDGSKIEGGGRVILATKDGEFRIPEDADEGLVYIKLNQDFKVIGDPVFR